MILGGVRRALLTGPRWVPTHLFRALQQGLWLDPSDFSTMFQDSAGTIPVTAVGQPVGLIRDKSGRGNHASQSTATARPTLQQDASGYYYLSFDGVDDGLATGSIDFTGTAKMSVFAGVYKPSDTPSNGTIAELSVAGDANPGAFNLRAAGGGLPNYQWAVRSATTNSGPTISATAPDLSVLTLASDLTAPSTVTRKSGAQVGLFAGPAGGGNFGNYPLYIGRRAGSSLPFNGRVYGVIVRGATSTNAEISNAERFIGQRMGIAL